jgi:hypothetical protein
MDLVMRRILLLPTLFGNLQSYHQKLNQNSHIRIIGIWQGAAVPYPSKPYGQATSETAFRPFQGWLAHRAGDLRPSSTPLDTRRQMCRWVTEYG